MGKLIGEVLFHLVTLGVDALRNKAKRKKAAREAAANVEREKENQ